MLQFVAPFPIANCQLPIWMLRVVPKVLKSAIGNRNLAMQQQAKAYRHWRFDTLTLIRYPFAFC